MTYIDKAARIVALEREIETEKAAAYDHHLRADRALERGDSRGIALHTKAHARHQARLWALDDELLALECYGWRRECERERGDAAPQLALA